MSHKDSEMNEIEAALAAWTPRAPQIDRDRLMFAAGHAAAPTLTLPLGGRGPNSLPPRGRAGVGAAAPTSVATRYLWPLATSLSTAAALMMAFLLAQDRSERAGSRAPLTSGRTTARAKVMIAEIAPTHSPPLRGGIALPAVADGTYLALRNRMLTTPADEWPIRSFDSDVPRGATAVEDDAALQPPTSRNLLREFLPPEPDVRRGSLNSVENSAALVSESHEAIT